MFVTTISIVVLLLWSVDTAPTRTSSTERNARPGSSSQEATVEETVRPLRNTACPNHDVVRATYASGGHRSRLCSRHRALQGRRCACGSRVPPATSCRSHQHHSTAGAAARGTTGPSLSVRVVESDHQYRSSHRLEVRDAVVVAGAAASGRGQAAVARTAGGGFKSSRRPLFTVPHEWPSSAFDEFRNWLADVVRPSTTAPAYKTPAATTSMKGECGNGPTRRRTTPSTTCTIAIVTTITDDDGDADKCRPTANGDGPDYVSDGPTSTTTTAAAADVERWRTPAGAVETTAGARSEHAESSAEPAQSRRTTAAEQRDYADDDGRTDIVPPGAGSPGRAQGSSAGTGERTSRLGPYYALPTTAGTTAESQRPWIPYVLRGAVWSAVEQRTPPAATTAQNARQERARYACRDHDAPAVTRRPHRRFKRS